jgi:hypothetical protein
MSAVEPRGSDPTGHLLRVTNVYDRYSYTEKKTALNWRATRLLAVLEHKDKGKCFRFAAGA